MANKKVKIKVGDIYEDCSYHPVLCTESDGENIEGISLIDGTGPRSCSIKHCGVVKLTLKQAVKIKKDGPSPAKKKHVEALMKAYPDFDLGRNVWWK